MQPPQNPYNQPGYGSDPYGSPSQQPRGTVSLDVIGEAWNLVKGSLGQWILAILVVGIIALFCSFIFGLLGGLLGVPLSGGAGRRAQSPGAAFYLVSFVTQLLNSAVQGVALAALLRMAISHIRTGVANVNELFGVTEVLGAAVLGGILVYLATVVGFILCIIPGIIAALGLAMTPLLIVDQKMQPVDAMKRSWEVMKPHLGSYFVLGFVLGLLNIAGALACGFGLFVTTPIYFVSLALVYRDLFGVGGTPVQNTGYTPPPIANPNF